MSGISKTKYSSQYIDNLSFDDELKVKIVEIIGQDGVLKNPATEETLQSLLAAQSGDGEPVDTFASNYNLIYGSVTAGDISTTLIPDGNYLTFAEDVSTGLTVELNFTSIGKSSEFFYMTGYYAGGGSPHYCDVFAYNWTTASYDEISASQNKLTSSNGPATYEFALALAHTDTNGAVKIKIEHNVATYNASHRLYLDYVNVHYHQTGLISVKNSANQIINPATEETLLSSVDTLVQYKDAGMDISSNTMYFGFLRSDGAWCIKQLDTSSGTLYANGTSGYSTAWSGRAGLSYVDFNQLAW